MSWSTEGTSVRRRGKEVWERAAGTVLLAASSPLLLLCSALIKLEAVMDPNARGPVFFTETRISRGNRFNLLKFRTLNAAALSSLGGGDTHIAHLEKAGATTRSGRVIRQWYLDELPQLINIARGDIGLVGTRPWPIELYEEEMSRGITRKRDMPAGLVGPVQSNKGDPDAPAGLDADLAYWEAYKTYPGWKLFLLDLKIIGRSLKVQLKHEGI